MMIQIPAMMPQKKSKTPQSARKNVPSVIGGISARRFLAMAPPIAEPRDRNLSSRRRPVPVMRLFSRLAA